MNLAAEQIHRVIEGAAVSGAMVDSAQLRALAITAGGPVARFPGVPPVAKALPGYEVQSWFGLFAPAATPVPVTEALRDAVAAALGTPPMRRTLQDASATPGGTPSPAFRRFIEGHIERYRRPPSGVALSLD